MAFKRLFFTGHSLGCGLSSLALPDVIANVPIKPGPVPLLHYILASPRVGDPQYAYKMAISASRPGASSTPKMWCLGVAGRPGIRVVMDGQLTRQPPPVTEPPAPPPPG